MAQGLASDSQNDCRENVSNVSEQREGTFLASSGQMKGERRVKQGQTVPLRCRLILSCR